MSCRLESVVKHVAEMLIASNLSFKEKPILIGGMAMEYYGMREAGAVFGGKYDDL